MESEKPRLWHRAGVFRFLRPMRRSTLRRPMPDTSVAFDLAGIRLDFTLPLPELLRSVERQIARAGVEVGFVFGASGQLLVQRVGSATAIRFTGHELSLMPGATLTHNHPRCGYFSTEDLLLAHQFDLWQLNAVAGRYVYQLTRPVAGWDEAGLQAFLESETRKIMRQFAQDRNRPAAQAKRNALAQKAVKALSLNVDKVLL